MNIRRSQALRFALFFLIMGLGATAARVEPLSLVPRAWAQSAEIDVKAVENRLANVRRLLYKSSGAQRVETSESAEAKRMLEEARGLFQRAERQFKSGDAAGSNVLLEKSTLAMFEAIRVTGIPPALEEKRHSDFESRADSIEALMDALQRIGAEKGSQDKVDATRVNVEQLVREAKMLEAAGKRAEGRRALDAAYDLAKRAIEDFRGGDTLVRSLKFETVQDEFLYELDRNDTHQMLVKVLLEEKRESGNVDRMVKNFVDRADALRVQAERLAERGDYKGAVDALEQSTKELVRAIRGAGVYIPG